MQLEMKKTEALKRIEKTAFSAIADWAKSWVVGPVKWKYLPQIKPK
jgi:hypothetical protein